MTNPVLLEQMHGKALCLTLNRPDQLNAFNDALYNSLANTLTRAANDPNIAAVMITGAGRAFSAGQDLEELGDDRSHDQRQKDGFTPFIEAVESFPKPLVAAVNGIGVGIGMTILPHCDLVLISDAARLRVPFTSLGLTAEAGSSLLLTRLAGWQKAADMLFRSRWMLADEAVACGIALEVMPADQLLARAHDLLDELSALPVTSLKATKQLLLDARLDDVRAARARENTAFATLVDGPANREALAAFAEKRPANFDGI